MTYRRLLTTCGFGLAAMFAPSIMTAASADVAYMDDFKLTGVSLITSAPFSFDDMFSLNRTLAGGAPPGKVLPSGVNFSDGSPGSYSVIGTLRETGNKAVLDTALGARALGPAKNLIKLNNIDLLTGPPTLTNPFSLAQGNTFTATGLFDLTKPSTPEGLYQLELSDRVKSNFGMGDVISIQVKYCIPGVAGCKGVTSPGYFVQLQDANFATGTSQTINRVPLDTNNQQILLELSHDAGGDVVGSFAYVNNGIPGSPTILGTYDGLFAELEYTQAGFTQVAPVPEPSSFTLLVSSIPSVLGLLLFKRRRAVAEGRLSRRVPETASAMEKMLSNSAACEPSQKTAPSGGICRPSY